MHSTIFRIFSASFLAAILLFAQGVRAAEFSEAQTAEIQQIIKEYIGANPSMVMESLMAQRQQEEAKAMETAKANIPGSLPYLTGDDMPSAGNPKGDVTVVEFFDYNCGYCKHALADIKNIIASDKNVRFVFQDMPILGEPSMLAAQWAQAADRQGKFFEYHSALLEHHGAIEKGVLEDMAKKLGLDVKQMETDANSPAIQERIAKSVEAGRKIGIQGTPGFLINGELFPGYIGEDGMKNAIGEARKKDKKG